MKAKMQDESTGTVINIIGKGTEIKGDIVANGDIRINGTLVGNLNTNNKLILGDTGLIQGEITANVADISGKIKGKLLVKELVILRETANLEGELITKRLIIEEGAIFNGTCTMKEQVEQIKPQKPAK